ncbi:uncharacterized protein MONBRDRAFT_29080 [Monosiga brevicollis MX1]|uniref:Uncharacterized protein n=1 Tax=Monosiga brevicollis TaxID=81824 RepID=A9VA23_MONBE|nr:uncharacterized protein MONBRDRAFT_29080 [Monosiga brevicollis MX1]EDQ85590.1 predicted protein [Monosiga brevicollis MX1]|eukprot:XP_001749539.1 hypothetical protein [Monosiga brevicollis MX1]
MPRSHPVNSLIVAAVATPFVYGLATFMSTAASAWTLAVLLAVFYSFDVHYFCWMAKAALTRHFGTRIGLMDTCSLSLVVWLNDIDFMAHTNNARYPRAADVGRYELWCRNGVVDALKKLKGHMVLGACTTRFRRSLDPLERYQLQTRVLCWDDSAFYVEQRFVTPDGFVRASFYAKQSLVGTSPQRVLETMGLALESPPIPEHLQPWLEFLIMGDDAPASPAPVPSAATPGLLNAADLNLTQDQMIGFMSLVRDGRMTIDQAIERAKKLSQRQDKVEKQTVHRVKSFDEQLDILGSLPPKVRKAIITKIRQEQVPFDEALAHVLDATYGPTRRRTISETSDGDDSKSPALGRDSSSDKARRKSFSQRLRRTVSSSASMQEGGEGLPRMQLRRRSSVAADPVNSSSRTKQRDDELEADLAEVSDLLAQLKTNGALSEE